MKSPTLHARIPPPPFAGAQLRWVSKRSKLVTTPKRAPRPSTPSDVRAAANAILALNPTGDQHAVFEPVGRLYAEAEAAEKKARAARKSRVDREADELIASMSKNR